MRVIGDKNQISEDVFDFMISYLPFPKKSIRSELAKLFFSFSISIFTDSLSVMQALEGEKTDIPLIVNLLEKLCRLCERADIVFCWLSSHIGIRGKEEADKAAKDALSLEILPFKVPLSDFQLLINTDSLEDIHERVNIIISNFPDVNIPLFSSFDLRLGLALETRLLFTKYESFDYTEESINFENTFHFEQCIICNNHSPNVLFCNCGHLGICSECYKKYNKKQCVSCRMINTIVRIL